jgi:hypothetical protein
MLGGKACRGSLGSSSLPLDNSLKQRQSRAVAGSVKHSTKLWELRADSYRGVG